VVPDLRPGPHARAALAPELAVFLARRLDAARGGAGGVGAGGVGTGAAPAATLDALLLVDEPWPLAMSLALLAQMGAMLDEAAAAGVALGAFTPRCVAVDGSNLTLVAGEDPATADPIYVAPELVAPGGALDGSRVGHAGARAGQYGLAVLAIILLDAVDDRTIEFGPGVERVLRAAHNPDPARRFPSAAIFTAALALGCRESLAAVPPAPVLAPACRVALPAPAPAAQVPVADDAVPVTAARIVEALAARAVPSELRPAVAPDVRPRARRVPLAVAGALLVGVAVFGGTAAEWYAAREAPDGGAATTGEANGAVVARPGPATRAPAAPVRLASAGRRPVSTAGLGVSAAAPARTSGATPSAMPDVSTAVAASPASALTGGSPAAESVGDEPRPGALAPGAETAAGREITAAGVRQLATAAAAVALPNGDLVPSAPARVSLPSDFATGELGRSASRALTARGRSDPDAAVTIPDDVPVRHRAVRVAGDAPRYPDVLIRDRREGAVVARFEVDADGRVEPSSIRIMQSSHGLFTESVRRSLRRARYLPTDSSGARGRQWMQLTFRFDPPG
jgi:protein TonB